jgi:hypothetical protein
MATVLAQFLPLHVGNQIPWWWVYDSLFFRIQFEVPPLGIISRISKVQCFWQLWSSLPFSGSLQKGEASRTNYSWVARLCSRFGKEKPGTWDTVQYTKVMSINCIWVYYPHLMSPKRAYNSLLWSIPASKGINEGKAQVGHVESNTTMMTLCWEDYPNINFWMRCQWTKFSGNTLTDIHVGPQAHGRGRAAQNINVAMWYAELEDGTIIDGDRAGEIQKFARSIWVSFAKKGPPPPKWGQ